MGEAIRFGWETFKKEIGFILGIEIAALFAEGVVTVGSGWMERIGGFHEWAMSLAYFVVTMIIQLGAIKIALKYRDGEKVEFANLFDSFDTLPVFMVCAVITAFLVGVGMLFLLIPGIFLAVKLWFCGFVVVDEKKTPIDAIRRGYRLTDGYGLELFLFGMLLFGINLLGVLCVGIGLFVSLPVSYLAAAHIYRVLNRRAPATPPAATAS
jgi:uncharacterized membrane protein